MRVLILGAYGKIARIVEDNLLQEDIQQRLFLRNADRLTPADPKQEVIDGSSADIDAVSAALKDVDVVYANLAGKDIEEQAKTVVAAMDKTGVKRLIWISTLGIYDEVPGKYGEWNHKMLDGGYLETYGAAAKVIEASDIDFTIIRPAWLTNHDEVEYELTKKGEPFKGTEVSRKSIADFVTKLILDPQLYVGESLGVDKPGTDGDKPAWY
ncbi:SDR family oxidoreductase [Enterococcus devriesei]|uniref:SDR family oxidoreductase n=1 Tax=Enterococcus devriesei TaxID=319970 RepID=UPI001C10CA6D|nr:SDR family oxidoreductase [Enterococcus devriesei]MBU5365490.1 SDR family oxidoreductase [Enterococcus devriesei]